MSQPTQPDPTATTTATTPPPTTPPIDVEKIKADAIADATKAATKAAEDQATKLVGEKLKKLGTQIAGGEVIDPAEQLMGQFLKDPVAVLKGVKDIAKTEMAEDMELQRQHRAVQNAVANPIFEEYPELRNSKKLAMVEKLTDDYVDNGMPYAEALKKGFDEAVKEFGLTSVTERQKKGEINHAGLPGGGGVSPVGQRHDEQKSQTDFLTRMQEKAAAVRHKK